MLIQKVKSCKGFTLVEVLVVIVLITIFAALILPGLLNIWPTSNDGSLLKNVITQEQEEQLNNTNEQTQPTDKNYKGNLKTKGVNKKL